MNFASSIYSKLEPRIEDEIGRTTEGRWFFVSETRPIIRDVLFSRGKTRALFDIRWVASGGTRRRAKRRRSFSDLGINCKLVYRPQRTLGCWFIRRVVAAFASSSPSSLRSPFNSGSPVPSRPSNSRAWPTTKHPPFANGNCRKFHRILPRLASYRTSEERRDKRLLFLSIPSILHEKGKDPIPPPRKDSLTTIQNCRFRGRFPSKGKSYAHADKFRGIARKERKGGGKEEGGERGMAAGERDPAGHDPANEPEDANQSHDAALQIVHLRSNAAIPFPLQLGTGERLEVTAMATAASAPPSVDVSPLGTSMSRCEHGGALADTLHER